MGLSASTCPSSGNSSAIVPRWELERTGGQSGSYPHLSSPCSDPASLDASGKNRGFVARQEVIRTCLLHEGPHYPWMHQRKYSGAYGQPGSYPPVSSQSIAPLSLDASGTTYSGTYGQPGIYPHLSSPSGVPLSSYRQKLVYPVATHFL